MAVRVKSVEARCLWLMLLTPPALLLSAIPVNFWGMCSISSSTFLLTLNKVQDDRQHTAPNF
jgi:hypothetical protein